MRHLNIQSLPVPCYFVPFRPICLFQHHILKQPQPSLSVRAQILDPHKTGKTAFLNIAFFIFSDSKLKDKILWTEWQQAFSEFTLPLISS
jgi:hypothetical protein